VIGDEVDDAVQPAFVGFDRELGEIGHRTQPRVDRAIVGDVVAVVAVGGGLEGHQPEAGDAESREVVEPAGQPAKVADPVAVRVGERLDVEAIDDRVLVPLVTQAHLPRNSPCEIAL
jgi:hypothetical protein